MSLSSPQVPAVPNPTTTANQQQNLNTQTLTELEQANNVNQVTPTGSLTYAQTGTGANGVPTYTATQTLSPQEQALLTAMQGSQTTAGNQAGSLLTNANYGSTNPATTIGNSTSGETQALLGQETSYLNPQFNQQTSQLTQKLASQGIYPGSPAYDQQMQQLQLNQNQAVTGFLATAEPAAYQQATSSYELPAQLAESLGTFGQPTGVNPTTTPQETSQPANLEGDVASANTANMAAYNAQLNQQNGMLCGLFGIGAAGISGGTGGFGNSLLGSLLKTA